MKNGSDILCHILLSSRYHYNFHTKNINEKCDIWKYKGITTKKSIQISYFDI